MYSGRAPLGSGGRAGAGAGRARRRRRLRRRRLPGRGRRGLGDGGGGGGGAAVAVHAVEARGAVAEAARKGGAQLERRAQFQAQTVGQVLFRQQRQRRTVDRLIAKHLKHTRKYF